MFPRPSLMPVFAPDDTLASGAAPAAQDAPAAPEPAVAQTPAEKAVDVVTKWFNDDIQNSGVSRDVGTYNLVQFAVDRLKARLTAAL